MEDAPPERSPSKITSVAWPSSFGPMTYSAMLTTARPTTATMPKRSRRSMPAIRLTICLKLAVFSAGMPKAPKRPDTRPQTLLGQRCSLLLLRSRRRRSPGFHQAASSWRCDSTISR